MRCPHGDDGTILPIVLMFFLLAATLVLGGAAASSAFLAQRDLAAACDGAAVAAADGVSETGLYGTGATERLPLSQAAVADTVAAYAVRREMAATSRVSDGGTVVTVTCTRTASVTFGDLFGVPQVERTAVASARSPLTGAG